MCAAKVDAIPESDRFGQAPHPRQTDRLFGHASAEKVLLEAYRSGRLAHAWILGGDQGIGKATLAWRFGRFLLAHPDRRAVGGATGLGVPPDHPASRRVASLSHGDLVVLRREWNERTKRHFTEIRVDEVRRATHVFRHAATADGYRVCILDCAEDLNRNAANALLKLIEEPPSRSVFLIIAHRPGRVLATIRSRCRLLMLQPPEPAAVAAAVRQALDGLDVPPDRIDEAVRRSRGSVRDALKLLDADAVQLHDRIGAALAALPEPDWLDVHRIADSVATKEDDYATVLCAVLDWIDMTISQAASGGPRRLAPYAQVWEKLTLAARETEALNLDKRPLILQLFADLAAATRTSHG